MVGCWCVQKDLAYALLWMDSQEVSSCNIWKLVRVVLEIYTLTCCLRGAIGPYMLPQRCFLPAGGAGGVLLVFIGGVFLAFQLFLLGSWHFLFGPLLSKSYLLWCSFCSHLAILLVVLVVLLPSKWSLRQLLASCLEESTNNFLHEEWSSPSVSCLRVNKGFWLIRLWASRNMFSNVLLRTITVLSDLKVPPLSYCYEYQNIRQRCRRFEKIFTVV